MNHLHQLILAELAYASELGGYIDFPWKQVTGLDEIPQEITEFFAAHGWNLSFDRLHGECLAEWNYSGYDSDIPEMAQFNRFMRDKIVELAVKDTEDPSANSSNAIGPWTGTAQVIEPGYCGFGLHRHAAFLNSQIPSLRFTPTDNSYLLVEKRLPLAIFALGLGCDYPIIEALRYAA